MGFFLMTGILFLIFATLWGSRLKKASKEKRIVTTGTVIKADYLDSYAIRYRIHYQDVETGEWHKTLSYSYQRFKSKKLKSGDEVTIEYRPSRRFRNLYILDDGMISVDVHSKKILVAFWLISTISFITFALWLILV